jgi:hypothetical protein
MYAIRYRTSRGRVDEIILGKWHFTDHGHKTLCGRLIPTSQYNEEDEDLNLIDCVMCMRGMESENILPNIG